MLREILPDLVLLAVAVGFLVGWDARATAPGRVRRVSAASLLSRRIDASAGSCRPPTWACATDKPRHSATLVTHARREMPAWARGALSLQHERERTTILPRAPDEKHIVRELEERGLLDTRPQEWVRLTILPSAPDEPHIVRELEERGLLDTRPEDRARCTILPPAPEETRHA